MKVYIAGPISLGDTLPPEARAANLYAFDAMAAALMTHAEYTPVNPTVPIGDESSYTWQDFMRKAFRLLADCDAIVMLPGWQLSTGARSELIAATLLNLTVLCAADV